jgi:hypothetical protein
MGPKQVLLKGLDKGLEIQRPAVLAHVERARRSRPQASPREVLRGLEKQYLASVSTVGAAAGASAAIPGEGQAVGLVVNVLEVPAFIEASILFAIACAEVHGVEIHDLDRRRTLALAILLGNSAARTSPHWAKAIVSGIPMSRIHAVNRVLGRNFVTKYGTKQGILVLGRDLPLGLGAAIGAGGNLALGYTSVRAARRAFGPAPDVWPVPVEETVRASIVTHS